MPSVFYLYESWHLLALSVDTVSNHFYLIDSDM